VEQVKTSRRLLRALSLSSPSFDSAAPVFVVAHRVLLALRLQLERLCSLIEQLSAASAFAEVGLHFQL